MNQELTFILIASFGAISIEAVNWYELRNKIEDEETKKLIFSKFYWIIVLIMIVISGVGAYILFFEPGIKKSIPFVLGAAFPLIFKKTVSAFQERHLGSLDGKVTFEKVFKKYMNK